MTAVKRTIQRLQVALASGLSVATVAAAGLCEVAPLTVAAIACAALSGACWLMCE